MSYPTVRSDPYKAGLAARRRRTRHLWTESQWRDLVKAVGYDDADATLPIMRRPAVPYISPACLDLIAEFNRSLAEA